MSSNSVSKILFLKYSDFSLLYRNMDIKEKKKEFLYAVKKL